MAVLFRFYIYRYSMGSIVLLILNTINETAPVSLNNEELSKSSQDVYWLTPYPATNITSRLVICIYIYTL